MNINKSKLHRKKQINTSSNGGFQQSKQFLWPVTFGCLGISNEDPAKLQLQSLYSHR